MEPEVMPCVVTACDGVWLYIEGETSVVSGLPPDNAMLDQLQRGWADRMCDGCRAECGAGPRIPIEVAPRPTFTVPVMQGHTGDMVCDPLGKWYKEPKNTTSCVYPFHL